MIRIKADADSCSTQEQWEEQRGEAMKVLVPVDVLSKQEIKATSKAILDNAWPDDVEFYLFNVIENGDAHTVEERVHALSKMMRALEAKMPNVPFFLEVVRGDLRQVVANWLNERPSSKILTTRPLHALNC
jgi:hypothetical protein